MQDRKEKVTIQNSYGIQINEEQNNKSHMIAHLQYNEV